MSGKIFLSVGSTSNERQENFVTAVEQHLQANDLVPQTVGRTYFTSQQPLKAIDELMRQCVGTVIIAYERLHIGDGIERRGSPKEKGIRAVNLPTPWNQIEAAMAYSLGHPLLVIVENGIKSEGLLEVGYDWYVQWVDLDPAELLQPSYAGAFADWKRRCEQYQQQHELGKTTPSPSFTQHAQAIPERDRLIALRQILNTRFSEGELRVLCFDLGVDFQNLPGDEKIVKAMELVSFLQRTNRLDELIRVGRDMRPNIEWPVN
ncbi:MAG: hypothetical protein PVH18_09775 [Chloroflexota bacterium]|jgi:hypothetical protein